MCQHTESLCLAVFSQFCSWLTGRLGAHDIKTWKTAVLKSCLGPVEDSFPCLTDWVESCSVSKQGWIVSGCIGRWTAEVSLEGDA